MTIKEFASLCKCSTQTLRYYDRIDLLKPSKVDPWSGYRYYVQTQAIDFIKIKNLQAADFSISEIKALLDRSDQDIYDAFTQKIREQEHKLERIKEIQQSYLTEKNTMENIIHSLCGYLTNQLSDTECLREFGLVPADAERITRLIRDFMESHLPKSIENPKNITLIIDDEIIRGNESVAFKIDNLDPENLPQTLMIGSENVVTDEAFTEDNSETLWECRGWDHVYEFLDRIPQLTLGREYCFLFHLTEAYNRENISFPLFMIGAMIARGCSPELAMSCCVDKSTDGQNHFALLQRK